MRTKLTYIIAIAIFGFLTGCDEDTTEIIEENKITIAGEEFTPSESQITKNNDGFEFSFSDNNNSIIIATNDTLSGSYTITPESTSKSAYEGGLEATVSYINGSTEYAGVSGTIEITISADGSIAVSFKVTVKDIEGNEIVIEGENFSIASQDITDNTESIPSNYFLIGETYYELIEGAFDIMSGAVTDEPSYVSILYLYTEEISYSEGDVSGTGTLVGICLYSATNEFVMGSYVYDIESTYYSGTFDCEYYLDVNIETYEGDGIEFDNGTLSISNIGDEYEITFTSSSGSFFYKGGLKILIDD